MIYVGHCVQVCLHVRLVDNVVLRDAELAPFVGLSEELNFLTVVFLHLKVLDAVCKVKRVDEKGWNSNNIYLYSFYEKTSSNLGNFLLSDRLDISGLYSSLRLRT